MSGGGGGAGGGLITDANARLLVEDGVGGPEDEDVATRELPVFDWTTDVDPPSIEAGDSVALSFAPYVMSWGRAHNVYSPEPPPFPGAASFVSVGAEYGPTLTPTHPTIKHIASLTGTYNTGWTYTPGAFGCGLGLGSDSGWDEKERWYMTTMPEPVADAAGISFSVTIDGPAVGKSVVVRIRSAAPTAGRQGTVVATIPVGTSAVTIPGAALPAEGSELWVGFAPGWQADYDLTSVAPIGYPAVCRGVSLDYGAEMTVTDFSGFAWAVYSAASGDLGYTTVLDDEDDPWTGGNSIIDMGSEGGTSGVSDGAFYSTDAGGRCLATVGDLEDDEEPRGPWSDGWSVTFQFSLSALGDAMDTQPSEIEVTTTRSGERTVGTIHFGDTSSASGIEVESATLTDFAAFTFTADARYAARFDDRSDGWLRGKVWLVSDGEPAEWDVEVEMPEESADDGDRVVICIRSQDGQTVRVYPVYARATSQGGHIHERLGIASGTTDRFVTSQRYQEGSLGFTFAGVFAPPVRESGETCEAWMDYKPTAGMVVWADYLTEGG